MRLLGRGCAISVLAVCALTACGDLPGRPDEAERYRRPSEIMDFASLYATNCSGCHGADGRNGPARPLGDPIYLAFVGPARVRVMVERGVPGTAMPAFSKGEGGTLTREQIAALTKGLFEHWADPSTRSGEAWPPYDGKPGRATRGAQVYAQFCASCHGADGRGSAHGGSVVDASFLALVSDQMLRSSVLAGRPDLGMPDWRTDGDRAMTPTEISDVVAWMADHRRVPPEG